MLEVRNIILSVERDGEEHALLNDVSFNVPPGHLIAIVGPSGCGKTTLMKTIAGLKEEDSGDILWEGRNLAHEGDLHPSELGYVPQFSIAHELLTVEECVASAIALRTCHLDDEQSYSLLGETLTQTGLGALADRQVKVLSGGQKRRLGLALELVTDPALLLCDEVTSGLDPKSEREITQLLHDLAHHSQKRMVINVTHSLANLALYDTVLVLHEGRVVYHGPPRALAHYFSIDQAEDIYPKLARRTAERWASSWERHRDAYYRPYGLSQKNDIEPKAVTDREPDRIKLPTAKASEEDDESDEPSESSQMYGRKGRVTKEKDEAPQKHEVDPGLQLPGLLAQTHELWRRRWLIFWRDRGQMWLHILMLFGFPLLVVIFGYEGIPGVRSLSQHMDTNVFTEFKQQTQYTKSLLKAGGLISGLIMFQVVLVTLMASNNAAREIAGERDILEREKLGGLRPLAYVLSKTAFLGVFVLAQSLWMGLFVELVCPGIPGELMVRLGLLVMASAAMTMVCLGISAVMRSPEKATILCIYLVGFQLPLSGAVLALPKKFEPIVQPFIAAFWSWSGSLHTVLNGQFAEAVNAVTNTTLKPPALAFFFLALHVAVGLTAAYAGTKRSQWD